MKLATSQAETQGNLVYKRKFPMRISEAGRAIIIKSIIDMYSQPYVAALREYTSNAFDSHVWAGQTRPFEVTLPTRLQPNLIIQDWGIGLSGSELEDYAQFGESTKRDTNDQIGGFGLGSKSGLAVCSRFTVESVKDGKRSVVVIGRDADGPQGGMLIEDEDTDLPNGLKVTIPTTEVGRFQDAIDKHFFLGYPAGAMLINGQENGLSVYDTDKFEPLDEAGWLGIDTSPSAWSTHDYLSGRGLVGPVAYKIDWSQAGVADQQARGGVLQQVVVKLDNGEVDLTPSREGLIYSARTRRHIQERVQKILTLGKVKYQQQVEKAPTLRNALILMFRAKDFGFKGTYSWKGQDLGYGVVSDDLMNSHFTVASTQKGGASGFQSSKVQWHAKQVLNNMHFLQTKALSSGQNILVVENDAPATVGRSYIHRLAGSQTTISRALASRDSRTANEYQMVYTSFKADDLPEVFRAGFVAVMTAAEVNEILTDFRKKTRAAGVKKVPAVKRDQELVSVLMRYSEGASWVDDKKIADLDKSKKYILLQNLAGGLEEKVRRAMLLKVGDVEYGRYLNPVIAAVVKSDKYDFIFANKTWKTENYTNYLTFVSFEDAAKDVYKDIAAGLTPMQRLAAAERYNYTWVTSFGPHSIEKIKRADLREYIQAANNTTIAPRLEQLTNIAKASTLGLTFDKAFSDPLPHNPAADYPLLAHVGYVRSALSEIVEYINMIDEKKGRIATAS